MMDVLGFLVGFIVILIVAAAFGVIVAVSQILGCVARNMREKD